MNLSHDEPVEERSEGAGFALTAGDIEIFRLIYEYRLLRIEHLSGLTSRSPKKIHGRLIKLVRRHYIIVIRLPQQKHIYALGRNALPVLVEQGIASPEILDERLRVRELKDLFLKHEMMIVDLHVVLAVATRGSVLKLIAWREGRELYDTVTVSDQAGVNRLPMRPDAFLTVEDSRRPPGANRAHFFLEADRSTATQTRFKDKIHAYWHYLEQGLHAEKFGIKNFRMITVTLTHARARNLCGLAASLLPQRAKKYFLFTSVENFSLQHHAPILETVYLSPRDPDAFYPLVPPPNESATAP